jgi:hypothetical protein
MSVQTALPRNDLPVPAGRFLRAKIAAGLAWLLERQPPARLRRILSATSRGAEPATFEQAKLARDTVTAVSLACAGPQSCLPRSIATALLCRMSGVWPVWCTGVRKVPPFAAHAWVEADGKPVGEQVDTGLYQRLITVSAKNSG